MTPLGSPVLPLLKMIVAMSSTSGFLRAAEVLQQPNGCEKRQQQSESHRSRGLMPAFTSSRKIELEGSGRLDLAFGEEFAAGDQGLESRLSGG